MIASSYFPCGCTQSFAGEMLIEYRVCPQHYAPDLDDPKVVEAAMNALKIQHNAMRNADAYCVPADE